MCWRRRQAGDRGRDESELLWCGRTREEERIRDGGHHQYKVESTGLACSVNGIHSNKQGGADVSTCGRVCVPPAATGRTDADAVQMPHRQVPNICAER